MSTAGLLILIASTSSVTSLFVWCIWKILTVPGEGDQTENARMLVSDLVNEEV